MNLPNQTDLLKVFSSFLIESGLSAVSVKNYLCDLRHFLAYCATIQPTEVKLTSSDSLELNIDEVFQSITKYINNYSENQKSVFTPLSTTNRRLASIRRFTTFLSAKYGISNKLSPSNSFQSIPSISPSFVEVEHNTSPSTSTPQHNTISTNTVVSPLTTEKILNQFKSYLEKEKKTHSTIKNYLSDLNHFFLWTANQTPYTIHNLINILSESQLSAYVTYLKLSRTSVSVINRRQSSIKKLARFCAIEKFIPENPFELKQVSPVLAPLSWIERMSHRKPKKVSDAPKTRLAIIYSKYNALPFTPYLHIAILVLVTSAMAIFGYNQIISSAKPSSAATALTPPKRQLSFQGRLTDSSGTPITTSMTVAFKLFNVSSGGAALYQTTPACTVSPDTNGIFNTLIGDGTCGAEINSSVFTDNRDIYLEISVGAETLTPRQQIATVGYALNSETLQGYPASASATANTVPVMDNEGNIVLSQLNPSIIATPSSGTFTLKGDVLSLQTSLNSGGDIILQPDALGQGQILAIGGTTDQDSFRITNANLTTGSLLSGYVGNDEPFGRLISLTSGSTETDRFWVMTDGRTNINSTATESALVINQNGTGDLISASTSGVTKFNVSNSGSVNIAGQYLINGSPLISSRWQNTSGSLAPLNITDSINIGSTATSSAMVHLAGTAGENSFINTGSFGIGKTNPGYALDVTGEFNLTDAIRANADAGSSGWLLTSSGGGVNTWTDPSTISGVNYWQRNSGVLSPSQIWESFNLGNVATASATVHLAGVTGENSFINTGNFGVGMTNPAEKLDVNGGLKLAMTTNANAGTLRYTSSNNLEVYDGTYWAVLNTGKYTKEITGFNDRTSTALSFVDGTLTFTITGTNFPVFIKSQEFIKNTESIAISNTIGLHYIYYDASGTLTDSMFPWSLSTQVPIASVYWNGSVGLIGDERHGLTMDNMTHEYLHKTVGSRFDTGFNATFTSTAFSLSAGSFYDEDLKHASAAASTSTRVVYRIPAATSMTFTAPQVAYYTVSGGASATIIDYDNAGTITDVPNNNYVAYWVFATNDPITPIYTLMGQRVDGTLTNARNNNVYSSLSLTNMPFAEMKLLYRVLIRNAGGTPTYIETEDERSVTNLPSGTYIATAHGNLTGLLNDDHTQYALLAGRTLGQTIVGGIAANETLTIQGNSASGNTATNANIVFKTGDTGGTTAMSILNNGNITLTGNITGATGYNGLVITPNTGVVTTGTWNASLIPLAYGGTNKNMTAVNGGVVWTDADSMEVSVAGIAGQVLTSNGAAAPSWTSVSDMNFWQRNNGVLSPNQIWESLNLGDVSTVSATVHLAGVTGESSFINGGNFGLGVTNPGTLLHVRQTAAVSTEEELARFNVTDDGTAYFSLRNGSTTDGLLSPQMRFRGSGSTTAGNIQAMISTDSGTSPAMVLTSQQASSAIVTRPVLAIRNYTTDLATMLANGNFGIGITNPAYTLDVTGELNLTDAIRAGGNAGNSGDILISSGGGVNSWVAPSSISGLGENYWQRNAGALSPVQIWESLNLGDVSTASATVHLAGVTGENSFINTGSFGIGTTSPSSALQVAGNTITIGSSLTNATRSVLFTNATGGTSEIKSLTIGANNQALTFSTTYSTSGERMRIDGLGNVGIGTTTPTAKLDVVGDASTSASFVLRNATASTIDMLDGGRLGFQTSPGGDAGLTEKMTILSNGNVGIGTTTPSSILDIFQANKVISNTIQGNVHIQSSDTQDINKGGSLTFGSKVSGSAWRNVGGITGKTENASDQSGFLAFFTNGSSALTEKMRISSNGNVGIGTTTPTALLDIAGDASTSASFVLRNATASTIDMLDGGRLGFQTSPGGDAGLTEKLTILSNGNVGIGTTTPTTKLDVVGVGTFSAGLTVSSGALNLTATSGVINVTGLTTSTISTTSNDLTLSTVTSGTLALTSAGALNLSAGAASTFTLASVVNALNFDSNTLTIDASNNRVGIGLTNPTTALDVVGVGTFSTGLTLSSGALNLTSTSGAINATALGASTISTTNGNLTLQTVTTGTLALTSSGALNLSAGAASTFSLASVVNALNFDSNTFTIDAGNNRVGIGLTNPRTALEIAGSASASGNLTFSGSNPSAVNILNGNRLDFMTSPGGDTGLLTSRLTVNGNGIVGIGITNPAASASLNTKLVVGGQINPSAASSYSLGDTSTAWNNLYLTTGINNNSGTQMISIANSRLTGTDWNVTGKLGVGTTTTPTATLDVTGSVAISTTLSVTGISTLTGDVSVGGGTGKIDVGLVDPPYTINGEKFATYMASMIGVKEETVGKVLSADLSYVDGLGYRTLIDLDAQPKGSDLWLFSKTTNMRDQMSNLSVLLTAAGQAKTWYEMDTENKILAIFSSTPTDVTFRLTAPRFDAARWTNARTSNSVGYVLSDSNNNPNTGPEIFSQTAIAPELIMQLDNSYKLKINGVETQEVSSFASSIVANFKAGVATVNDLLADNLTVKNKLISPIANIDQLRVIDATISGTLYADNIKGQTVDRLNQQLDLLSDKYSTASAILADLQSKYTSYASILGATSSATITGSNPLELSPLASISAETPSDLALNSLNVHTILANDIMANGSVFAQAISSFDTDLFIQPSGDKKINLLAGLMILHPEGKIEVRGDLVITGTIYANNIDTRTATVSGSLALGKGELATDSGKLIALFGNNGQVVGSVDASGSANFGQLTTDGLIIASGNANDSASSSAQINSNTTIGIATIATGSSELVIANNKVTSNTLIYITPISDTNNQVLFVKSKQAGVGFTVAVPAALPNEVSFNYWLVQTK